MLDQIGLRRSSCLNASTVRSYYRGIQVGRQVLPALRDTKSFLIR